MSDSEPKHFRPKGRSTSKLYNSSEVLQGLFENGKSALSEQFIRWKIWRKWSDYAGPSIGAVSEPVGYRRGTLYVWVKNASWMQQLIFMLEPLKESINKKLEISYVKSIHLTLDRKAVPSDSQDKSDLRVAVEKLMKEGEES
jgi:predicted nucleic acid-binding Zn ribbon protein